MRDKSYKKHNVRSEHVVIGLEKRTYLQTDSDRNPLVFFITDILDWLLKERYISK